VFANQLNESFALPFQERMQIVPGDRRNEFINAAMRNRIHYPSEWVESKQTPRRNDDLQLNIGRWVFREFGDFFRQIIWKSLRITGGPDTPGAHGRILVIENLHEEFRPRLISTQQTPQRVQSTRTRSARMQRHFLQRFLQRHVSAMQTFVQISLRALPEKNVVARQTRDQLVIRLFCQIKFWRARRVLVADAIEATFQAIDALRIAGGVLRAMIAVIPIEDIHGAVGADFERDGHEPGIVGGKKIRLGGGAISGAVAMEAIDIDAAAVNVADVDEAAIFFGIGGAVEHCEAAIRGLLMTVIGDRTDLADERREGAGLAFVVAGLDEMKEMIVGPVTGFDDGAAFEIPGKAVRIAGAFGDELEFASDWMKAPQGAIEFKFLSFVGDAAFVEDAIQAVEPAVGTPGEGVWEFVGVRAAEAGQRDFAGNRFAVFFAEEEKVRRI
jgi:hypothetical protein